MTIDQSLIQNKPVISAIINADNTGVLSVNGTEERFAADDAVRMRTLLMTRLFEIAIAHGRPVRVSTMDENGLTGLLVSPDRQVEQEDEPTTHEPLQDTDDSGSQAPTTATASRMSSPELEPARGISTVPGAGASTEVVPEHESASLPPSHLSETSAIESGDPLLAGGPPTTRRALRDAESFLSNHPPHALRPHGVRRWLSAVGITIEPSDAEQEERADIEAVSRHWPGTRTIMVANRKGGANKTPTVKNLAAVFARHGGGGVLAYDGNPEVGTLGWRTEQGDHQGTVLDVLENSTELLAASAVSGDIARYVHHQPADKFDVLRSDDSLVGTHIMTGDDVEIIHRVAAKYYRLLVMDSGNADRGSDWTSMIAHTNQLVVPTTTMDDRAEAALLMLKALQKRDEHAAQLARDAVVIISQWHPGENSMAQRIAEGFRPYVRAVLTVPFDPALKSGRIVHDALTPASRRAWLRAAAAVSHGL